MGCWATGSSRFRAVANVGKDGSSEVGDGSFNDSKKDTRPDRGDGEGGMEVVLMEGQEDVRWFNFGRLGAFETTCAGGDMAALRGLGGGGGVGDSMGVSKNEDVREEVEEVEMDFWWVFAL